MRTSRGIPTATLGFNDFGLSSSYDTWRRELNQSPFATNFHELQEWETLPEWEWLAETTGANGAGEQWVNTSTWSTDPLRSHGGTGANLLLRWNNVPASARSIDVVVHLHGYIGLAPNEKTLRAVAARSGLDLSTRTRPTLAILPRGRRITPEEVRQKQARMNEMAGRLGKKPGTARSDVYTFPALIRDGGAGLESLIKGSLQHFARQRGGGELSIARLILTAHSGGGAALDRLVALHGRRRVCNPEEVHAFDALYSDAGGLRSWVTARLGADRRRTVSELNMIGGGLRVFYRPGLGGTQGWSERLGRSLPPANDPLSRLYRIDCTLIGHLDIPNQFGPALLRDRAANLSSLKPCSPGARGQSRSSALPKQQPRPGNVLAGELSARAALPADRNDWIRSTERSAIELVADPAQRRRLLQEVDWSREYFPGNPDAQGRRAPGRLAEELFNAMARVTPERRVPTGIRYRDVTHAVISVPGQPGHKLFPEARDAFVRMRAAAAADGVQLQIISSWRSRARQQAARGRQANPLAVARGISAHNYGLAVDLNMRVSGLSIVNVSTRARDKMANMVRMYRSPNYKWLALNASRFGWFPYRREPWHWEYNPPGFAARFEAGGATAGEFENVSFGIDREFENSPALGILSSTELKAVRITSTFETGRPGGFGGLTGNFDGQGLSFGLLNFTIKAGSLIPLLQEFITKYPTRYANAFGRDAARFKEIVSATKPDPQNPRRRIRDIDRQMAFVNTQMNAIPRKAKGNRIIEPWKTYFGRLENDSEFQKIQVKAVRGALGRARYWYNYFGFSTERGFAFMFDLVSSHGGAWLNAPKFKGKRRALLQKMLADKKSQVGRETLTDREKMEAIANMIADVSLPEWREKARVRKLWFVRGIGKVHGTLYDIKKDFGITDSAPDFGASLTREVMVGPEGEVARFEIGGATAGEFGNLSLGLEGEFATGPCPDVPVPVSRRPKLLVRGSPNHSATREVQRKLNAFHAYRLAAGLQGLRDSPLVPDCIFGKHTFEAVKSFQELVFPGMPEEHDGKVGPHTWGQLDAIAVGPGANPAAQLTVEPLRIVNDAFTGPLSWDEVIGLNTASLNLEFVALGLPPAVMPTQITIEISSRAPNRAGGVATLVTPLKLTAARFRPDSANANRIIYRLSRPLTNLGDFLKVERQIKEVTNIVRRGGTSDVNFRRALGWNSRGIATQPIAVGVSSGSESAEIPDAFTLFRSAGVEVLEARVPAQPNWRVPGSVKRLVRSPADVVYYSGHGLSGSGKLGIDTDIQIKPCPDHGQVPGWLGPADLTPVWTSPMDLDVLILAGCSVLKIDFTSPPTGPGVAWSKLLRAKGGPLAALLGYADRAPCDSPRGETIAAEMAQRLTRGSTSFARDWLTVNGDNNATNAVAMDDQGYWWIQNLGPTYVIRGPKPIP